MSNLSKQDLDDLFNLFYGDFEALAVYLFLRWKGDGIFPLSQLITATGIKRRQLNAILSRLIKMELISVEMKKNKGAHVVIGDTKTPNRATKTTHRDTKTTFKIPGATKTTNRDTKMHNLTAFSGVVKCEQSEPKARELPTSIEGSAPEHVASSDDAHLKASAFRDTPLSFSNLDFSSSKETSEQEQAHIDTDSVNVSSKPRRQTGVRSENTRQTQGLLDIWNEVAKELGLPKVRALGKGQRRVKVLTRLKDEPDLEQWRLGASKISESDFLTGANDRGWLANFDWFIRPDTLNKLLEGVYLQSHRKTSGKARSVHFGSRPEDEPLTIENF